MDACVQVGAAAAPVYDAADMVADPQIRARSLKYVPDSDFGQILMQDVLARMSATPGEITRTGGAVGQDNEEIYHKRLGLSDRRIRELREEGVI